EDVADELWVAARDENRVVEAGPRMLSHTHRFPHAPRPPALRAPAAGRLPRVLRGREGDDLVRAKLGEADGRGLPRRFRGVAESPIPACQTPAHLDLRANRQRQGSRPPEAARAAGTRPH